MAQSSHKSLLIIFLVVFIDLLGFGIVLPLLPVYGKHFQMSGATLGLLMASFSAMQFLFAPIWGGISDRVGRRPILLIGLAGSTVSYALFGVATGLGPEGTMLGMGVVGWLFVTRIGAGIAGATITTAQAFIADTTSAKGRGKGMALIGAAFGLGFTFGPLIGAPFVSSDPDADPSSGPGYVAAILSALAFLGALFYLPESRPKDLTPRERKWLDTQALLSAFSRPQIALLLVTIFLTTFAFANFETTLSVLVKNLEVSDREIYKVYAYIGFILTISQGFLVRRFLPKVGEYRMSIIGTVLMILGFGLIIFAQSKESLAALMWVLPITVVGFSALTPSLQSLLSQNISEDEQGQILGVGQSMSALARILGPMLGLTMFYEVSTQSPYWAAAGLMTFGLLLVVMLKAPPKTEGELVTEPTPEAADETKEESAAES